LVDLSYVKGLVDEVLIADANGNIIYQTDNSSFVRVTNLAALLKEKVNPADKANSATSQLASGNGSTVQDILLSGTTYQLFVQPQFMTLPMSASTSSKSTAANGLLCDGLKRKPGLSKLA